MTKKLLLAAGAVAALAFAGAANAGSISQSSTISGVQLANNGSFAPLTIASEAAGPTTAKSISTAESGVVIVNALPAAASVSEGATNVYEVVFTPAGGAFSGASKIEVNGTGITPSYTQLGLRPDGTVAALVSVVGGTGGGSIASFKLTTGLTATSEADITVASTVNLIASGVRIAVDSTNATTVARFRPLIASTALTATPATATAALPNYTSFKSGASADLASAIKLNANAATGNAGDKFYAGLALNTAQTPVLPVADLASVVTGGTLTITGSAGAQLDKLQPKVGTGTPAAATLTDTTAVFTIGDNTAIETTGLTFSLTEPSTAVPLNAATYQVSFAPTFASDFTAPTTAYGPVAAGSVVLEGTNFNAPWFTLNNPNNTATLRLANNGTTATGPVFVTLKANNGTAAATTARITLTNSLAAGQVLEVTGATMAAAFGTNAQNGDLQVTVQGDGSVISGKVRVRNVSGATFESSLGNLK